MMDDVPSLVILSAYQTRDAREKGVSQCRAESFSNRNKETHDECLGFASNFR